MSADNDKPELIAHKLYLFLAALAILFTLTAICYPNLIDRKQDQSTESHNGQKTAREAAENASVEIEDRAAAISGGAQGLGATQAETTQEIKEDCKNPSLCGLGYGIFKFLNGISNIVVAVFTIATVWYAYRAWCTYKEELEVTKNATKIQLKPYLSFVDVDSRWGSAKFPNRRSFQIFLRVKNTGNSTAFDISQITYNHVAGQFITDPADPYNREKNINFVADLPRAKIFSKNGVAMPSLNSGDDFCFHAHIPFISDSDLPDILPDNWVITFAVLGEFTFYDAIFKVSRKCEIGVVTGGQTSVEMPSGVAIISTTDKPDGQIIQSEN